MKQVSNSNFSFACRPDRDAVLLLVAHHIVADFRSLEIILGELDLEKHTKMTELPEFNGLSYAGWARQNRFQVDGPNGELFWEYWREQLRGTLPIFQWPTRTSPAKRDEQRGNAHRFRIPVDLTSSLQAIAQENGCTIYVVLLAALNILLHRFTNDEDIMCRRCCSSLCKSRECRPVQV
jgi:hypothetical protein